MRDREKRCSECLQLQKEEMESPYVCEECESKGMTETEYHEYIRKCNTVNSITYPDGSIGYFGKGAILLL